MLKVKTYLDRSLVHGIGLFAAEKIRRNQEVWVFDPRIDLVLEYDRWQEMAEEVAPQSFSQVRQLAYKEDGKVYLCIDNAQFMNHCRHSYNIANRKEGNTMVARRDIARGDELLCNYFEFCDHDDWSMQWLES